MNDLWVLRTMGRPWNKRKMNGGYCPPAKTMRAIWMNGRAMDGKNVSDVNFSLVCFPNFELNLNGLVAAY